MADKRIAVSFAYPESAGALRVSVEAWSGALAVPSTALGKAGELALPPGAYVAVLEEGGRSVQRIPFAAPAAALVALSLRAPTEPLQAALWQTHRVAHSWVRFLNGPAIADQDLSLWLSLFAGELWKNRALPTEGTAHAEPADSAVVFLTATPDAVALRFLQGGDVALLPVEGMPELRAGTARVPSGLRQWGISTSRGVRYYPLYLLPGHVSFVIVTELAGKERAVRMFSLPFAGITAEAVLSSVQALLAHEQRKSVSAGTADALSGEPILDLLRAYQLRRQQRTEELAALLPKLEARYSGLPDLQVLADQIPTGPPLFRERSGGKPPAGLPDTARVEWQGFWNCWLTDALITSTGRST